MRILQYQSPVLSHMIDIMTTRQGTAMVNHLRRWSATKWID